MGLVSEAEAEKSSAAARHQAIDASIQCKTPLDMGDTQFPLKAFYLSERCAFFKDRGQVLPLLRERCEESDQQSVSNLQGDAYRWRPALALYMQQMLAKQVDERTKCPTWDAIEDATALRFAAADGFRFRRACYERHYGHCCDVEVVTVEEHKLFEKFRKWLNRFTRNLEPTFQYMDVFMFQRRASHRICAVLQCDGKGGSSAYQNYIPLRNICHHEPEATHTFDRAAFLLPCQVEFAEFELQEFLPKELGGLRWTLPVMVQAGGLRAFMEETAPVNTWELFRVNWHFAGARIWIKSYKGDPVICCRRAQNAREVKKPELTEMQKQMIAFSASLGSAPKCSLRLGRGRGCAGGGGGPVGSAIPEVDLGAGSPVVDPSVADAFGDAPGDGGGASGDDSGSEAEQEHGDDDTDFQENLTENSNEESSGSDGSGGGAVDPDGVLGFEESGGESSSSESAHSGSDAGGGAGGGGGGGGGGGAGAGGDAGGGGAGADGGKGEKGSGFGGGAGGAGKGERKGKARGLGGHGKGSLGWRGLQGAFLDNEVVHHIGTGQLLGDIKSDDREGNLNVRCLRCGCRVNKRRTKGSESNARYKHQGRPMGSFLVWLHLPCDGEIENAEAIHRAQWTPAYLPFDRRLDLRFFFFPIDKYRWIFDKERAQGDDPHPEPLEIVVQF